MDPHGVLTRGVKGIPLLSFFFVLVGEGPHLYTDNYRASPCVTSELVTPEELKMTITYSRGLVTTANVKFFKSVLMPLSRSYGSSESLLYRWRGVAECGPLCRYEIPMLVVLLHWQQLQPKRNGDISYGSSADAAQIELRSLTSESWTEALEMEVIIKCQ